MPDDTDDEETGGKLKSKTFKLSAADIAALSRITKRRYPRDTSRETQVIRELIREDDERGAADEQK